jgi:hypothetical protein
MIYYNNDYLLSFNIPINTSILLREYNNVIDNAINYSDPRPRASFTNWKMVKHNFPYAEELINFFSLGNYDVRPRFYLLTKNTLLKQHVDNGTQCSLNFILSTNNSPINFREKEFYYTQALINTQSHHGISEVCSEDRILFKLSIMDLAYNETKPIIENVLSNSQ